MGKSAHASNKTVPCRDKKSGFGDRPQRFGGTHEISSCGDREREEAVRVVVIVYASRRRRNKSEAELAVLLSC